MFTTRMAWLLNALVSAAWLWILVAGRGHPLWIAIALLTLLLSLGSFALIARRER